MAKEKSTKVTPDMTMYQVKKTNPVVRVLIYIGLIFWLFINLFPIYWMFTFSLKNNEEIFGENIIGLPKHWLWSNYAKAMGSGDMFNYFKNSIIVAVATIIITTIAALMATYAITRLSWKGSKLTNSFFMLGLTIPMHAAIIPIYIQLSRMHLLDSYIALIVPYSAFSLAMAILICTGFMVDIPKDLDEAAHIDGCGVWGIFFRIIVPLMRPALSTIGIYTFLQCWNELMFASIFNSKSTYKTLPSGIQELSGRYTTEWGPIGAALAVATFPTLIVYIFLSRKIQESFIAGAVKG
ncbi:MAG: carbohydrate ABC transporter permease [Lachnospiraceae bacterium]|nr:carbohydrate ABC transporter permease [Lachnospiraceae bacterium]